MESELYSLLNNLFNPKKFPVVLSLTLLLSIPAILEVFLIAYYMRGSHSTQVIVSLEALSVLLGYLCIFSLIKFRIHQAVSRYKETRIYRLVGSFPAALYLLSPGFISLFIGLILLAPAISHHIGRKIIRVSHIDPNVIYTLLELNSTR